jgi:hypothetical protein
MSLTTWLRPKMSDRERALNRVRVNRHAHNHLEEMRIKSREKYIRNKAEINAQSRRHRQQEKAQVIALLGGKCQVCGTKDHIVLTVHHITGWKNSPFGGVRRDRCVQWRRYLREIKAGVPLNIVCFNCHARITWGRKKPPPPLRPGLPHNGDLPLL